MIAKANSQSGGGSEVRPVRRTGIELLRIISMIGIILFHFGRYLGIDRAGLVSTTPREMLVSGITGFGKFGVALFFITTGYFLYQKKTPPKAKRVWSIIRVAVFYWLVSAICAFVFFREDYSYSPSIPLQGNNVFDLFSAFLGKYWFISAYTVLMIIAPYLKKMFDNLSDKELTKLCLIIVILATIILDVIRLFGFTESGIPGTYFPVIFTYPLVGYTIARREKDIRTRGWAVLAFMAGSALIMLSPVVVSFYGSRGWAIPVDIFRRELTTGTALAAIGCFILFLRVKWQSRFVNYVASLTLAIYLIHNSPFLVFLFYTPENVERINALIYGSNPLKTCVIIATMTVIVFVVCGAIEIIRRLSVRAIAKVCALGKD